MCNEREQIRHRDKEPPPPFPFEEIDAPQIPNNSYSITEFGAVSGDTDCSTAIRQAIEHAAAAGGGRVVIPRGEWITGPIHLRSKIELHIAAGAVVKFSRNFSDYLPTVRTRWEGMECYNYSPLIYACNCTDIAITGGGVLDGQGAAWHGWKETQLPAAARLYDMSCRNIPIEERQFGIENGLRPSFIQPFECRNVLIENITVKSGPMWTIHPVYCRNLRVNGCTIITRGANTDGCNLDSCSNAIVENCYFDTGDDCICLKSGINEEGWRINRPCENIIIRYCYTRQGHGGIVIGSEISGGVRNIFAYDCLFKKTARGIRFKSMRGRGALLQNFYFDNITMEEISHEAVLMTMFYDASTLKPKTTAPTELRDIHISNLKCHGCEYGFSITGLPEKKISNIYLENIAIKSKKEFLLRDVSNFNIS